MDILNDDDSGDLTDVSQDTFDTRLEKAIESRLAKLFERYESILSFHADLFAYTITMTHEIPFIQARLHEHQVARATTQERCI